MPKRIDHWRDKTVIVTGASAGVGLACAQSFARLGANLVLVARSPKPLKAAEEKLATLTNVQSVAMDVADEIECTNLLRKSEYDFGHVHGLINNAGLHERGPVESIDSADLARMIDVNLRAPIVLTRLALPYIRKAGEGAIVNVASLAGCTPVRDAATYSASKFGLRAFSMSLADEIRDSSINIGLVSPGPIDTGFIMDHIDDVADITFSQPMSTAAEVAEAVVKVASGQAFEMKMPPISGFLTTLSYLFPSLRRTLKPMLDARGRRQKEFYRQRARDSQPD
ncbi:MAG: SDR family oxidoreductase [Pseudomonadota bacterium]